MFQTALLHLDAFLCLLPCPACFVLNASSTARVLQHATLIISLLTLLQLSWTLKGQACDGGMQLADSVQHLLVQALLQGCWRHTAAVAAARAACLLLLLICVAPSMSLLGGVSCCQLSCTNCLLCRQRGAWLVLVVAADGWSQQSVELLCTVCIEAQALHLLQQLLHLLH